jgi:DNA-binding helix-hairpin-helix protein with protein kinase domain
MQLRRPNGQLITLTSSAIVGAGGEARIFAVSHLPDLAAKVYHRPTLQHAAKLAAMLANPPEDPSAKQGHISIAWPIEALMAPDDSRRVLGFMMGLVRGMSPVIDFYHPRTRRRRYPLFNYRYLLHTGRNIAACLDALHDRDYVIGDLNESNILVAETSLVTLVDTDSFQVPDPQSGKIYRCPVGKAEFTAPELQKVSFAQVDRRVEHDLFALGVLLFQLLMEGTHPFAGQYVGAGEPPLLEERIATGQFPYGGSHPSRILPMRTAPPFDVLGPALRRLFIRCFTDGHSHPWDRPDARTWQWALEKAEDHLVTCPRNEQHQYGRHLGSCPWCERRTILGGLDEWHCRRISCGS